MTSEGVNLPRDQQNALGQLINTHMTVVSGVPGAALG